MMLIRHIPVDAKLSVTKYTGSKRELISAGIANDPMFPAGRKRMLHSAKDDEFNGYHRWETWRIKGGKFRVEVWRKNERGVQPVRWKGEADFRQHVAILVEAVSNMLIQRASGETEKDSSGTISYRYSTTGLQRLSELLGEVSSLLADGEVEHARPEKVVCFPVKR
jgi:hypothetical protein